MDVIIRRGLIDGVLTAPPSKSYTHRALFCSSLAHGESKVKSPLLSEDIYASKKSLEKLGVEIDENPDYWEIDAHGLEEPSSEIFCQESGTTLRFATAVSSLVNGEVRLTGSPSLMRRPIEPLLDCLRQLGVNCASNDGYLPITVRSKGGIRGGEVYIRGDISSQFVSAILLIAPFADKTLFLKLSTPLESKPYVSMTIETQRRYGVDVCTDMDMSFFEIKSQPYNPSEYLVEGDWSSSAYLLAAGALAGRITVKGLKIDSMQADRNILNLFKMMGIKIRVTQGGVTCEQSRIIGVEADLSNCPDLFPIVAVLCSVAEGVSLLKGLHRLRYKESDRLNVMADGLRRMGVEVSVKEDEVTIKGGEPHGCVINPENDHRIAMAFAILGLVAKEDTRILNSECVSKSFPEFWNMLESLNANVWRVKDVE